MYSAEKIQSFIAKSPILKDIIDLKPVVWLNPNRKKMVDMPGFPLNFADMLEAEELWKRFAPFFVKAFPVTAPTGLLDSPLRAIPRMQEVLEARWNSKHGRMFLKADNALPVAGSIKARGGFFEVLHYAENLALKAGMVKRDDDYGVFASDEFKRFFGKYKLGVGSTGNLGLSIGIMGVALGFRVDVFVSADAKEWKKDLLRSKGINVVEFDGDFSEAILAGRRKTKEDPKAYFVDDENSHLLFQGYTVGALSLAKQLKKASIAVDSEHPLFVYSPCGVGGSPGGVAFGLRMIFGDHVHCFFVEPTHSPAVLSGLVTGEMSNLSVADLGIDNRTEADGLAVGRPSHFATNISNHVISGEYTIEDDLLFSLLRDMYDSEGIFLEPSATAGLIGPEMVAKTDYAESLGLDMSKATHVAWSTGGDLVPESQREALYSKGGNFVGNH